MRRRPRVAIGWCVGAVAAVAATSLAGADPPRGLATAAWRLESLEFRDGRRLEGVVLDPDPADGQADEIRFVQVVRPPGRPMYVITWGPLPRDRIAAVDRLPAAEHERLAKRVRGFIDDRQRAADAEAAVRLDRNDEDAPWRYAGRAFAVTSTADPTTTRSAIVTLDQVFGGLESLVPPPDGGEQRGPVEVRLCGSAAEYREVQRSLGIGVDAPAFYVPARRLLVAGGDLPALVAETAAADDELATASQRYARLDRMLDERLKALADDLERQGYPPAERSAVVQRARQRWDRERAAEASRITAARRAVGARLEAARRTFRQRLAHEAWHAYADLRLRPAEAAGLPVWLDEGLAQVVESAPLEAGELRLDAPDPRRLAALQQAIRDGSAARVIDLLRAGQEQFLAGHAGRDGERGLAYLAAWGLALDIAMLRPVLSAAGIVELTKADGDAVGTFERLVGTDAARYETEWRRRILALRPGRPPPEPPAAADVTPAR